MWALLKVFIEFITVLFLFYVVFFWVQGMWEVGSLNRVEPVPPAVEGEVLTTGPPVKSQEYLSVCLGFLGLHGLLWLRRLPHPPVFAFFSRHSKV